MLVLLAAMTASMAFAKDKDFKKDHPRRAEVNERIRDEKARIEKDLKDGKITQAQADKMMGELKGVKAEEKAEVKANGGYLTKTEQKQLNQELNQDGRQIRGDEFKDKHPRRAEVNARIRNEDRRIEQGEKSGALTPAEAKQLEGEVAGVKAQERAEVKANGGYLTKTEQKQLNQELNQDSKQIYDEKHGQ
jgi:hypothetical protein